MSQMRFWWNMASRVEGNTIYSCGAALIEFTEQESESEGPLQPRLYRQNEMALRIAPSSSRATHRYGQGGDVGRVSTKELLLGRVILYVFEATMQ